MLREMESIQKREAEDTAALENMVQQVEANLKKTTVSAQRKIGKKEVARKWESGACVPNFSRTKRQKSLGYLVAGKCNSV